jgi:hypothetical protein
LLTDKALLSMVVHNIPDLHGKAAMEKLAAVQGIEGGMNRNAPSNSLRRLINKNMLTKIVHGIYLSEDEAFADEVRHRD